MIQNTIKGNVLLENLILEEKEVKDKEFIFIDKVDMNSY